jgi:hypothetical protein
VLLVQVDLIVRAAESEPDGPVGLTAVNVVYVQDLCPLSHCWLLRFGIRFSAYAISLSEHEGRPRRFISREERAGRRAFTYGIEIADRQRP